MPQALQRLLKTSESQTMSRKLQSFCHTPQEHTRASQPTQPPWNLGPWSWRPTGTQEEGRPAGSAALLNPFDIFTNAICTHPLAKIMSPKPENCGFPLISTGQLLYLTEMIRWEVIFKYVSPHNWWKYANISFYWAKIVHLMRCSPNPCALFSVLIWK